MTKLLLVPDLGRHACALGAPLELVGKGLGFALMQGHQAVPGRLPKHHHQGRALLFDDRRVRSR